MKMKHWMWMAVVAALFATACGTSTSSEDEIASQEQSLVISYDGSDIEAGIARVDLTLARAVYVINAHDEHQLSGLRVFTKNGEVSITEVIGALSSGSQSIVLGAEPARVDAYLNGEGIESAPVSTSDGLGVSVQALRKVRCCDSCVDLGDGIGPLICSGCRGCDD